VSLTELSFFKINRRAAEERARLLNSASSALSAVNILEQIGVRLVPTKKIIYAGTRFLLAGQMMVMRWKWQSSNWEIFGRIFLSGLRSFSMSKIKNIRKVENEAEFKKAVSDATDGHITCEMLDAFRASGLKQGSFKDGKIIPAKSDTISCSFRLF
jgi:hypothetical protein